MLGEFELDLALSLLVLRIFADNAKYATAFEHLAFCAHSLD